MQERGNRPAFACFLRADRIRSAGEMPDQNDITP